MIRAAFNQIQEPVLMAHFDETQVLVSAASQRTNFHPQTEHHIVKIRPGPGSLQLEMNRSR